MKTFKIHRVNNFKTVNARCCLVTTCLPDETDAVGLRNLALGLRRGRWSQKTASVLLPVKGSNIVCNTYIFDLHVKCVYCYASPVYDRHIYVYSKHLNKVIPLCIDSIYSLY